MVHQETILILGSGGREHALAWKAKEEGFRVVVAPGSDGIANDVECRPDVGLEDFAKIEGCARELDPIAIIVGPEQPLVDGLADHLRDAGFATFGPSKAAARLEGSKVEAKQFMRRHGIPTARSIEVSDLRSAMDALREFDAPPVVKASGLAAGKGVVVAETFDDAIDAIRACLVQGRFGDSGAQLVLEERLVGEEVSFFSICDGKRTLHLAPCQDHKRIGEGDTGPNTGGMGAYLPAPVCDDVVRQRIIDEVVEPTIAGLAREGTPFIGVLFVGLMIDANGCPKVIEYNVRFGDPEAQPLMLGCEGPVIADIVAAARGQLVPRNIAFSPAATVVLASEGYPESSTRGSAIDGLEVAQLVHSGVKIFHAGTRKNASGGWESNGGRVLGICAVGDSLRNALSHAYAAVSKVSMPGAQLRKDIGWRALARDDS